MNGTPSRTILQFNGSHNPEVDFYQTPHATSTNYRDGAGLHSEGYSPINQQLPSGSSMRVAIGRAHGYGVAYPMMVHLDDIHPDLVPYISVSHHIPLLVVHDTSRIMSGQPESSAALDTPFMDQAYPTEQAYHAYSAQPVDVTVYTPSRWENPSATPLNTQYNVSVPNVEAANIAPEDCLAMDPVVTPYMQAEQPQVLPAAYTYHVQDVESPEVQEAAAIQPTHSPQAASPQGPPSEPQAFSAESSPTEASDEQNISNPRAENETAAYLAGLMFPEPPSPGKRRKRRCISCLKQGRFDAAYNCPGRGNRSMCPSQQSPDIETSDLGLNEGGTTDPSAPTTSAQSLTRYAPPSFTSTEPTSGGSDAPLGYHANGTPRVRKPRRCMTCLEAGFDGMTCIGRSSRAKCPNYVGETPGLGGMVVCVAMD